MSNAKPKWQRINQKTVYKGRVHVVEHDVRLPNGQTSKYEVEHGDNGAAAILIKTKNNEVILTHQYRFPLDAWIHDLPGGGKQTGETYEQAIARECQEEVGIVPNKLVKLVTFYPNPGRTDWPVQLYYCDDYKESKSDFYDAFEDTERVVMPIAKLQFLIDGGKIVDPSLLIAWYTARHKGYIQL